MSDPIQRRNTSLLWPSPEEGHPCAGESLLDSRAMKDLELHHIVEAIAQEERRYPGVERILKSMCTDPRVIAYRQDVFQDLADNPPLVERFTKLLPRLAVLEYASVRKSETESGLYQITLRLAELENYVDCVSELHAAFSACRDRLRSRGFLNLAEIMKRIAADGTFSHLHDVLPSLLSRLRGVKSVTIGVNLNNNLLPVEATLLSVNKDRFHGNAQGVMALLFGKGKDESSGIAPLHSVPLKSVSAGGATVHLDPETHGYAVNPLMVPLFKDLSDALVKTCVPIRNALKQYVSVDSSLFMGLKGEIEFYLGGLGMTARLERAGLPVCRPVIAPREERVSEIRQSYNVNLALKMLADGNGTDLTEAIVKNDVRFNEQGRILILTGPNRGGKTTYTQGIALAQLLSQAGLPVPGESARISPAEGIFTHFPIEEKVDGGTGRLGDEAKRFHEIFSAMTPRSLLVLNESFSSTSPGEGFHIALDMVRILQRVGARTIFATHLHELAAKAAELNAAADGNAVLSMVALAKEEAEDGKPGGSRAVPEFRIVEGPPTGKSHAREIALKYGIDYGHLEALLKGRGLIGAGSTVAESGAQGTFGDPSPRPFRP